MNNEKKLLEFFMGTENADHLYILILLVILDYITGICVAIHQKRLSSKIGFKGICLARTIRHRVREMRHYHKSRFLLYRPTRREVAYLPDSAW